MACAVSLTSRTGKSYTHDARVSEYLYLTRAEHIDRAESRYYNNSNSKFELV